MNKLVQINVVCNGSTGKIMCDISREVKKRNYETYCFFGRGNKNGDLNCKRINSSFSIYTHLLLARLGFNGHGSYFATKKLVKHLKELNPDIIHLHNIHGYYLNLKVLFKYLKYDYNGKIIWTLHDCWAFTGHCAYFTMANCHNWKKECHDCPQLSCYPRQFFDTTKREYAFKKELFNGINNLTIVTPSLWLKDLVKKSFLAKYNVEIINNGIDLDVFKPTHDSKIYEKYHIPRDKKIILGVANIWEERKGLNIFIDLSSMISNDEIIVLVGLNDMQIKNLPANIIGIKRTDNQYELACIYTICDVFVNPSVEETFSLVTAEAMACNTNVVVCDISAPKELVSKNDIVVLNHNVDEYYKAIKTILSRENKANSRQHVLKYQNKKMVDSYMNLYEEE